MDQTQPCINGKPLAIGDLVVTQYGYRDGSGLREMVEYVRKGGQFTSKPLITLFRLDDDRLYIHDGHHRTMAIYLTGRTHLEPSEYCITPFSFEALQTVNFDAGFVTPYDPRSEMRLSDFRLFKDTARKHYEDKTLPNSERTAMEYIQSHRPLYCISHRPYETIPEMVEFLGLSSPYLSTTSETTTRL